MEIIEIKKKYEQYLAFDEPIPYWSNSISLQDRNNINCLMFYPIGVKDYFSFQKTAWCLVTDHLSSVDMNLPIKDAQKIFSMSTYEYLYYYSFDIQDDKKVPYIPAFDLLLSLVMKAEKLSRLTNDEMIDIYIKPKDINGKPAFMLSGILYDRDDYENIRKILAYQNGIELPDTTMSKKLRDLLDEERKLKQKLTGNNGTSPSFEEQMICLNVATGISFDDIKKMSLRKFNNTLNYAEKRLHYQIYQQASLSGMVAFKDGIKYWMLSLEDDKKEKYKDLLMDMGSFEDKIDGGESHPNSSMNKSRKRNQN